MSQKKELIAQAQEILQDATYVVALTGAGISTPSGIPDFRSPGSGVWENVDPMQVASMFSFTHTPQRFFDWIRPLTQLILNAQPNAAHDALAHMEKKGPLHSIITQNIDLLHSKAGSQTIYEVHGHLRDATCTGCQQITLLSPLLPAFIATGEMPLCPACGYLLKPNVILFGEILPADILQKAEQAAQQCDVMLVAGSALEVSPVGELPLLARQTGAKLIFVNFSETHLDDKADVVIHEDVADVLPQLASIFVADGVL